MAQLSWKCKNSLSSRLGYYGNATRRCCCRSSGEKHNYSAPWTAAVRRSSFLPDSKLLIVIGEISTDHQLDSVKEHIKHGILSWDVDLIICDLNKELMLYEARHYAQFSSEVKVQNTAL
ncbi:electromotor neuron-associated protein 1-like [Carassius carassius]|uniref:electromotor neuron-associated protein 1-like n=1 Tax=Carassius carassius TaxID=217509 RepID=UPI002868FB1D|nr:electromotor neuron-associated protein 1-like [Carassius carassius]